MKGRICPCLLLGLGLWVACAGAFPQYRSLLDATSDFDLSDYEDDYDDRRMLAELLAEESDPVICGNTTTAFTISVSGPATATICTASQSLSDNGNKTCQALGKVYGGDCDVFLGSLYVNVGYSNAANTVNPDIQGSLAYLGLSKISQVGLLHVSVGSSSNKHLDTLDFLPNLKAIIGAANPNPGNGFAGAALFVLASTGTDITSMPSLRNLTDINGTTILQDLAVTNLTNGLQNLQIVEGDFVMQNNANLQSLAGTAQTLTTVMGQLYIANNPKLVSLAGSNATLARPGKLERVGGQLVIGGNTLLTSLAGLENLKEVGGPISIIQNTQLSNISALYNYAGCASNPTSETTPTPIIIQVVVQIQQGAPPITCILNTFVAICSYIKNSGCPNADGSSALDAYTSSGISGIGG